jgi:hypothetical protein
MTTDNFQPVCKVSVLDGGEVRECEFIAPLYCGNIGACVYPGAYKLVKPVAKGRNTERTRLVFLCDLEGCPLER